MDFFKISKQNKILFINLIEVKIKIKINNLLRDIDFKILRYLLDNMDSKYCQ